MCVLGSPIAPYRKAPPHLLELSDTGNRKRYKIKPSPRSIPKDQNPSRWTTMTSPRDIQAGSPVATKRKSVSHSWDQNLSTSPTATFHSPPPSWGGAIARHPAPKQLKPFNTQDIKILLLENVNQTGRDILTEQGYQVEVLKTSLPEEELIKKIRYEEPMPATDQFIRVLSRSMMISISHSPLPSFFFCR